MNNIIKKKYRFLTIALILGISNLHFIGLSTCNMTNDNNCTMATHCEMEVPAERNNTSCCSEEITNEVTSKINFIENANECNCFHILDNTTGFILSKTESQVSPLKIVSLVLSESQTKIYKPIFYFDQKSNSKTQSIPIYLNSNSFLI